MLTKDNVHFIASDALRVLADPSKRIGRRMRRLLSVCCEDLRPGQPHLVQSYALTEGYTPEQLQALRACAEKAVAADEAKVDTALLDHGFVVFDEAFGIVSVYYKLRIDLETASCRELRGVLSFLHCIAVRMSLDLHKPNETVLAECPDYVYRGLPCSVVDDNELWAVNGQDVRGGSGVLEWCVSEEDAREVVTQMSRFPERFLNVTAEKWSEGFYAQKDCSAQAVAA